MNLAKGIAIADIEPERLMTLFTVIPAVMILLAGASAIWLYFFVFSLLPDAQTVVETPGLAKDVRVVRDSNGVPGIIGEREEDLAVVLGYVMAQDRLWQIDYLRRAGQGRLAEVFGKEYLESDHLIRTVRAEQPNELNSERLTEREQKWLKNFVQGINEYIASHEAKPPVEFSLLEYRPGPFTQADIMAILSAVAWYSSPAHLVDPVACRLLARLGKDRALELLPTDPAVQHPFVASDLIGWEPKGPLFGSGGTGRPSIRFPGLSGGCLWAVGQAKSRSGKPLAGSAAYQALSAPGFWYRARLVAGDFHLTGAFIPGVPLAISGSNEKVSWGCVSSLADDADLYMERFDPKSNDNFWRVDRWKKTRGVNETYRIRGGSTASLTIHLTDTGPIVSDFNNGRALSLRWTGREGLGMMSAFYLLNRALDGKAVKESLRKVIAPCLNVVWADDQGGYGVQTAGRVPVRPGGSDGILPMPAWTGVHDWLGYIPFEELPAASNPADGCAVMADERPGGPDYPFLVSCYWNDDSRRNRIKELLQQSQEHYRETFQEIQNDTFSPLARDLTPVLFKALEARPAKNQTEEEAARILRGWDFDMGRDSAGPAIFGLFYQALAEDLCLKELGENLYEGFTGYVPMVSRLLRKVFLQNRNPLPGQDKPEIVLTRAFTKAVARGASLMGDRPARWKWGKIHATEFRHPLTARSRFLETLYDVGPVPTMGSEDTVNFAGWSMSQPFTVSSGVTLKQIADMTDPPQIFGLSPMGSSAHFFSAHYRDQTGAWLGGRPVKDPMQTADIRKNGFNPVLFKPASIGTISLN